MNIVTRDQWKAQPPVRRRPTPIDPAEQMGWVLHWYGRAVRADSLAAETKVLQRFQRACMADNGYSDLPHSFYVGQSGNVYEGRGWRWDQFANGEREVVPLDENGNMGWYSVCWLGGDNQQPTREVIRSITDLIHYSRTELGVHLKVQPYSDWRASVSAPGARLEQLARTLHNWPIPVAEPPEPQHRSVSAAANPALPPPPKLPPPPDLGGQPAEKSRVQVGARGASTTAATTPQKRSLVQCDDGDHAMFVTDGVIKEWVYDRTDAFRMCQAGEVNHGGRDDTGEFRPLLVSRRTLDALPTPGRLPLYPEGWNKGRTCR